MKGRLLLTSLCFYFFVLSNTSAQKIATLSVELNSSLKGLITPAKADLDAITFLPDSALSLVQVKGSQRIPVPFQISDEDQRVITWLIIPDGDKQRSLTYELLKRTVASINQNNVRAIKENGALTFQRGQKNLLRYQFAKVNAPAEVDTSYGRSGFIHPLWSPRGQILTRIQPPDHYHHYGIWNPWTHVLYEGDTVDFWNLNKKQGTVRFASLLSIVEGAVFSEYKALHEHVVYKKNGLKKVALNEIQTVRIFQPGDRDFYFADITIDLSCADVSPVLLLEYRYGGLGWRATEQWNKDNSEVLTSEGKSRKEADGSLARWCVVQGKVDNDYAGAVMMSYPANYNHPEPLRIWPENQYDRGDMFANFSPTKNKDWLLSPGKIYTLRYRFVVFNGKFTKEEADAAWTYFASPVKVNVKLN